jgi:acyl carrier protein
MSREDEIRGAIVEAIRAVAPEGDAASLSGSTDIRDALDIDSMDFLRFVVLLHEKLAVDIPERDYSKVRTLDTCAAYVGKKLAEKSVERALR